MLCGFAQSAVRPTATLHVVSTYETTSAESSVAEPRKNYAGSVGVVLGMSWYALIEILGFARSLHSRHVRLAQASSYGM